MLSRLSKLWGGGDGNTKPTPIEHEEIPRYPPFAKGLPVVGVDKLLATQAELIERIRNILGLAKADYARLVLPVIHRYAAFVHLLPASEAHHHRGAGGLLRHGLEVAAFAAQFSEAVMFSIEGTPRERRDNAPRWRLASCLSGLLHDIGKPLSDVCVTDKIGAVTWNPYAQSLYDWAMRHGIDRYFIRWRDKRHKRHEQFSLLTVERIITTEILQYLSVSGPEIIEALLEAIAGTSVNQPVTKLMLRADQESVSRDLRQSRLDVDEFAYGVPVERYVFDAIRRLVRAGTWRVNTPGAKLWHLHQGVFIVWKPLDGLYDLIRQDNIPGIPRDPDTLADILIERGFAVPNKLEGGEAYYRYWEVCPEPLQNDKPVKLLMLQLQSPELVFTTEPPAPVAGEVSEQAEEGRIEDAETEAKQETGNSGDTTEQSNERGEQKAEIANAHLASAPQQSAIDLNKHDTAEQSGEQKDKSDSLGSQPGSTEAGSRAEPSPIADTDFPFAAFEVGSHSDIEQGRGSGECLKGEPEQEPLPADAQTDLRALIATYGEAASLLETALSSVLEGKAVLGEALSTIESQVLIPYPEGAAKLGTPAEVMATLHQAQAIIPDPVTPSRKVQDLNGIKALVLAKPISKAVIAVIQQAEQGLKSASQAKQLSRQENGNKSAPRQQQGSERPERQNLARLPKRAKPVVLEKPLAEPTPIPMMESGEIADESSFLSQETTTDRRPDPAKSIEMLKEMIQKRSGRWLLSPVLEESGFLVTSDKALDRIAGEEGFSKHLLVGLMRSGQHHPLLQIREGKLYLQKD